MKRRQELTEFLDVHHEYSTNEQIATAVLEHLDAWVELKGPDLEAMPELSVVMDDNTDVSQKRGGEWCGYEAAPMSSTRLARFGPFRILHIGGASS